MGFKYSPSASKELKEKGVVGVIGDSLTRMVNPSKSNYGFDKTAEQLIAEAKAKGMKKGGMVSASKRADGCAIKGKTRGKIV